MIVAADQQLVHELDRVHSTKGSSVRRPNSEIAKNMQACASPGFYFEVSPSDGIADTMKALFQKAYQSAQISR